MISLKGAELGFLLGLRVEGLPVRALIATAELLVGKGADTGDPHQ